MGLINCICITYNGITYNRQVCVFTIKSNCFHGFERPFQSLWEMETDSILLFSILDDLLFLCRNLLIP